MTLHEYALLFPYHSGAPRSVLLQNFERARKFNRHAPLIPLIHDGEPVLPGTIDVRAYPTRYVTDDKWRSCDSIIYRWFSERKLDAKRYIIYEWDMYGSQSVPEFYESVWNVDVACVAPQTPHVNPSWYWFREVSRLGELAPFAAGLAPWAGVLLSARALRAMCEGPFLPDVACELRAGTLANHAGFEITAMAFAEGLISYHARRIQLSSRPGLYHPIKHVVRNEDAPLPAPRVPLQMPTRYRARRVWVRSR
jgi:hypothetical protein